MNAVATERLAEAAKRRGTVTVLESVDVMLQRLPLDDVGWLENPRWYNIAWMTLLEEVHGAQKGFASIY
jgi:hypothetical protein